MLRDGKRKDLTDRLQNASYVLIARNIDVSQSSGR